MVYYRTYRPQTIAELDSPQLRETLYAILSQKDMPHAFLFTGPKGLGKTSTARIIAKVLNCTDKKRDGIEPCNACDQCISITNGTNIDILEIDGASNRGIDEIRELRQRVNLAPVAAKKKVYIIDEVHMLTTEAFNALLKTIEEPPAHVVFIFATTEPQKVPATIISRCFHVSLKKATEEELVHSLERIIQEEKVAIDKDALQLIAQLGDGGYRDTQKLFEEIVALSAGKKITKGMVEKITNISGVKTATEDLLKTLSEKDVTKSLGFVKKLVDEGNDIRYVLSQILTTLHDVLLMQYGVPITTDIPKISLASHEVQMLITLFEHAYTDMKYAVIPSLPLELAIIEYCQENQELHFSETPGSRVKPGMTMNDARKKEQNLKVQAILKSTQGTKEFGPKDQEATQKDLPKDIADSSVLLENLIYKVKPYNHSIAGVLRGCTIVGQTDTSLTFQTAYGFHKEKLEEDKTRDILEKVVREVTGKNVRVMVELKSK